MPSREHSFRQNPPHPHGKYLDQSHCEVRQSRTGHIPKSCHEEKTYAPAPQAWLVPEHKQIQQKSCTARTKAAFSLGLREFRFEGIFHPWLSHRPRPKEVAHIVPESLF